MKFSTPLLVFTLTLILCSSLLIAAEESAENKNNDDKEKTNVDSLSMSLSSFSSSSHLSNKRKHTTLVMSDNHNAANGDNEEKELMRQEMKRLQLERAIHRFESNKKRRQAEQQSHSNNNSNSNSNSNNNEEEEEEKDFLIPYPGKDSEHGLHESHPRAIGKRRDMIARSGGTFETFAASTRKGIPPVMKYAEDTVFSTQKLVPAHISYADDPLNTFSIVEPVNGCSNTTNNRELTSVTAKYRQCLIAGNAGFFKVSTGACHGNLISDSKVVQNTGRQNVNFGIQKDGTITVGYLLSDDIVQAERDGNPFVQLIAGVIWLVRNGEIYVTESAAMEDMSVQETGSRFVDIVSGRAALGHDVYGRVVLYQVDGHSDRRGINLYELAELLVDRGVYNAINLDGGGSMTSVWNGTVVSYPSDNCPSEPFKCERKVTTIVCLHDLRCNPTNCSGHGTCIGSTPATAEAGTAGTCDCDFGWRPPNCSIPVNPCEDADYFEYVDWYKSTHNITSSSSSDPYSGGGNGGSGGGFVPDNDRKRRADTNSTASLTSTKSSTPTSTQSSTSKLTPSSSLASSASLTSQSSSLQSSSLSSSQSSTSSTTSSRSPTTSSRSPSPSLSPSPSPSPKVYPLTPGGCHVNATCSTTGPGKHVCSCKPGYYGNGTFCIQLPQPCPTAVSSSLYFSTSSVSSSSLASSTSILATTTVATATATTTAAVAAFDDSGGLINPECLPYAYWLIAIAIIALVAIAICLWALVSNSKKYKKLAFGIPSNEAREESLLEFQNQLTNQSNRSAQPVTRTYSNRGINGHNNSNNNNNGSSNIQNNNNNNNNNNNSEIQSSNNAFIIADDNLNNNNNSDDYLSQEYSPSIEDEQTSKGAGISMKTFVKGLVSTTSKISKKSLGSGPPFSELSGEDSDEKHIMNDVDVFGDDDL